MPRAFITGITGQDGSYLAESLLDLGWDVFGIGRGEFPSESPGWGHRSLHVTSADLVDWAVTERELNAANPDVIFNLAAISSVAQSWAEPALTMELNGLLPARLLEWTTAQTNTGRDVRMVQASSAEIFGNASEVPQTEATPVAPINPYGASKAAAHRLVQIYRAAGVHASNAILYNHESPRRPEHFVTRKITSAVARIAAGSGETLRLGNLDARRDWGWAPDYADALYRLSRAPEPDDLVIATGETHSVRDFVAEAFGAAGVVDWHVLVESDAEFTRPADVRESVGNASRAHTTLAWHPTVGFAELVRRMVEADAERLELPLR